VQHGLRHHHRHPRPDLSPLLPLQGGSLPAPHGTRGRRAQSHDRPGSRAMNFRSRQAGDEPEINLIPLIDVLLVILIFLAATTSFTRFNQMKLALPEARADALDADALNVAVSQEGIYALNGQLLSGGTAQDIAQ